MRLVDFPNIAHDVSWFADASALASLPHWVPHPAQVMAVSDQSRSLIITLDVVEHVLGSPVDHDIEEAVDT